MFTQNTLGEKPTTKAGELDSVYQSIYCIPNLYSSLMAMPSDILEEDAKKSLTDMLTGLPNRRHALHKLGVLWEQSIKGATPLACMIIDADHFKKVNDSYGHNAGDIVLCELAKTIQDAVRSDDIACRLGGDEFFVICPDTDEEGGLNIAEYIRKMVSELHVAISNDIWHGSISIGLATRAANMKNVKDLIKIADNSVYMAKRDGKNCVRTKS